MAFRKPPQHPQWEQMKPAERRAHQLDQQRVDLRMAKLLQSLPQATEQTRAEITRRLDSLDERERESFDRISQDLVRLGVNRDTLRGVKL